MRSKGADGLAARPRTVRQSTLAQRMAAAKPVQWCGTGELIQVPLSNTQPFAGPLPLDEGTPLVPTEEQARALASGVSDTDFDPSWLPPGGPTTTTGEAHCCHKHPRIPGNALFMAATGSPHCCH